MTDIVKRARVAIDSIRTQDQREISPPRVGITVIAGANNSGKSTFLREILEWVTTNQHAYSPQSHIIESCSLWIEGTSEDLIETLRREAIYVDRGPNRGYKIGASITQEEVLLQMWARAALNSSLEMLTQFFVYHITTVNRGSGIAPQNRRSDIALPADTPMHMLEDNPDLLKKVQNISRRIFRQTLTLDWISNNVQLRVGAPVIPAPPLDAVTKDYREALAALEPLQNQGDGMTAVLGLLVPIICGHQNVILIDEPEAFLHPPQARMIGTLLGELAKERELQILLATHDRNVLVGLLQSDAPVTVVRLDRSTSPTSVHELDYSKVRNLWDDPVLRYSNLLDGLFHHAVVLCEAERDCTFYSAALDAANERSELSISPGDILFVPAGGKDGFPGMIKALKAVSVPAIVIPDIDLLDDARKLRTLFEVMGGDWNLICSSYNVATEAFRRPRQEVTNAQVFNAVAGILTPVLAEKYNYETRDAIRVAMRIDPSPWEELKKYGVDVFRGQARQEAAKMLEQLRRVGIVVVEKGELENLAPSVMSKKGPRWLNEALEKKAYRDEIAQAHIAQVINAIEQLLGTD